MTTKAEIANWFDEGKIRKATHLVVVCDTFDHEDYPVYVMPADDINKTIANYQNYHNMSRVMEVYNLSIDKDTQLNKHRVWNI